MKIKLKSIKDWIRAILIALFLVLLFRNFVFETKFVKNNNMENTLLRGDLAYINKLTTKPRLPITILTIPFFGNLYTDIIQLPYIRLFGSPNIKINDIVYANYPMEHDIPIDKRKTFFSRCVALPGDTITIKDKTVFCNNKNIDYKNKNLQYNYRIVTNGTFLDTFELHKLNIYNYKEIYKKSVFDIYASDSIALLIKKFNNVKNIRKLKDFPKENTSYIFPQNDFIAWNKDNLGPLHIPKSEDTLNFNYKNIDLYRDIIENYEHNKLEVYNEKIYINEVETSTYIVQQNYYFVIDDNRDNAKDSRYWGFLPESHIIGKVSMVLFSHDKNKSEFRWSRFFKDIN